MKALRILVIVIRLCLGALFIYAGAQKFISKEQSRTEAQAKDLPEDVVKIKSYIRGLKQTGYFWPMLGIVEIVAGVLLVTQYYSLIGAFLLLPVTLNIFLFHIFLTPDDYGENTMTAVYLLANMLLIGYHYPTLKIAFLKSKI